MEKFIENSRKIKRKNIRNLEIYEKLVNWRLIALKFQKKVLKILRKC